MVTFANLRGDARDHPKLVQCLCNISSLIVIMTDIEAISDGSYQKSLQFQCDPSSTRYLLIVECASLDARSIDLINNFVEYLNEHFDIYETAESADADNDNESGNMTYIAESDNYPFRKEDEPARWVREQIKHVCVDVETTKLVDCAHKLESLDCAVEEFDSILESVIRDAASIVKHDSFVMKRTIVPLQGTYLANWCSLDRSERRREEIGGKSISHFLAEKHEQKQRVRRQQLTEFNTLSDVMTTFVKSLRSYDDEQLAYLFRWLNISFRLNECSVNASRVGEDSEENMNNTFGLNHILRECGQIYECIYDNDNVSQEYRDSVSFLPYVMAKQLLNGFQLELMDGETSYIPCKWIESVFNALHTLLDEDKQKLFVLSVIGVQSSGKSTLLNTMFGLQFAASSGRCTKGVNCRLIHIDKLSTGIDCDYMLIVDSEGLRSASTDKQHDNELATFTVAIGNATILNIKGESYSEMGDILQIIVHALVNVRLLNDHINLCPHCVFVHQNVSAVNAKTATAAERNKLESLLNDATKLAAQDEFDGAIQTFRDLIKFSKDDDIFFIPDLWCGCPPMAPISDDYVRKVTDIKDYIIQHIVKSRTSSCVNFADFASKVCDIWNAVTSNTFDTSFTNTSEIKAYRKTEKVYCDLKWKLEQNALRLQNESNRQLSSEQSNDLSLIEIKITQAIHDEFHTCSKGILGELEQYFTENEYCQITSQWQSRFLTQLQMEANMLEIETKMYISNKVEAKRTEMQYGRQLEPLKKKLRADILGRIHDLEVNLSVENIEHQFKECWYLAINSVTALAPKVYFLDLNDSFEKEQRNIVQELIGQCEVALFGEDTDDNTMDVLPFVLDRDIKWHRTINPTTWLNQVRVHLNRANECARHTVRKIKSHCDALAGHNLTKIHIKQLSHILTDDFFQTFHNETHQHCSLKTAYKVRATLSLFKYAKPIFTNIQKQYLQTMDPKAMLEANMDQFKIEFISRYKQMEESEIAANKLVLAITGQIRKLVFTKLAEEIRSELKKSYPDKATLIKETLKGICTDSHKPQFSKLLELLNDFNANALQHVERVASTQQFTKDSQDQTSFGKNANNHIQDCFAKVITATDKTLSNIIKDLADELFRCLECVCPHESLALTETSTPLNFGDFKRYTLSYLKTSKDKLCQEFHDTTDFTSFEKCGCESPLKIKLVGCGEQCPACRAPCAHSIDKHPGQHVPLQHIPLCLSGFCDEADSQQLVVDSCIVFDTSRWSFSYSDFHQAVGNQKELQSKFKWIFTKPTTDKLAAWKIIASNASFETCRYWNWVVAQLSSEIDAHYNKKLKCPSAYSQITQQKAEENLSGQQLAI